MALLSHTRSLREPPKQSRLGGFKVDDQLIFEPVALGVTMLRLIEAFKGGGVDTPDRGNCAGPGLNSPFCSTWPRQGRPSARWRRRAVISSPPLRRDGQGGGRYGTHL